MHAHRFLTVALVLALALSACGGDESPDGKFDQAAPGGKADAYYGECEIRQALAWVNDPDVSYQTMKDFGVHSRASKNIIAYRDGPDGIPYTGDDDYFDDDCHVNYIDRDFNVDDYQHDDSQRLVR